MSASQTRLIFLELSSESSRYERIKTDYEAEGRASANTAEQFLRMHDAVREAAPGYGLLAAEDRSTGDAAFIVFSPAVGKGCAIDAAAQAGCFPVDLYYTRTAGLEAA